MMDIRLYYEKAGDGEPLILLHGNGEDGTYFKHQMEYFSKDYRVIAIDTRGHGKSPRGEKPFTIRQFAEDLNGFMEEQGMEKAHLLGFKMCIRDSVKVDARYQTLSDYLLGRTLVVDHIDHGTSIAKKYKQSLRIVTLEGELINPGGSMTGGAFKNSSNLLSRRREIEEFEKTVKQLKREMDEMESSSESLRKERAGYYEKIDEISGCLLYTSYAWTRRMWSGWKN